MPVPDPQSPTAPAIPSPSDLAALDSGVAITLLVVIGVSVVMFYVGPIIRARFTQPQQAPPPPSATGTGQHALASPSPPPIETAAQTTQQFIDYLLRQVEQDAARAEDLERRLEAAETDRERQRTAHAREVDQLQQEIRRLETMLWQQRRDRLG